MIASVKGHSDGSKSFPTPKFNSTSLDRLSLVGAEMLSPFYKALRMVTDLLTALALVISDICESNKSGALQSRTMTSSLSD